MHLPEFTETINRKTQGNIKPLWNDIAFGHLICLCKNLIYAAFAIGICTAKEYHVRYRSHKLSVLDYGRA
jgi:hypothetical protein